MIVDTENCWLSTGIDIGTTTTHLTISRLQFSNVAAATRLPRLSISRREILYRSQIHRTPLQADGSIDAASVARIVLNEYAKAGIAADSVATGAAIITGETAALRNAAGVVHELARLAGRFVVAAAGAHLEGVLAGKGSGAAQASAERHKTICNVDIGGGTTNLAVFSMGKLVDSACIGIGGRCLVLSDSGAPLQMTDSGRTFFDAVDKLGSLQIGKPLNTESLELLGALLAEALVQALIGTDAPQVTQRLLSTEPLRHDYRIDQYWLSGGVAELMRSPPKNPLEYNDLGCYLSRGLQAALQHYQLDWHIPEQPARATVIGAGMHSLQLSGTTISLQSDKLPLRDLPVIKVAVPACDKADFEQSPLWAEQLDDGPFQALALALEISAGTSFAALIGCGQWLIDIYRKCRATSPLVIVTGTDLALALGQVIRSIDSNVECIVIDGIEVDSGDFIDIGRPLHGASSVPVTVKTLVFKPSGAN